MNRDYRIYKKKWIIHSFLVGIYALLLIVFTMPPVNGTQRWIPLGLFSIQPSEFAKLAAIFFVAYWLDQKKDSMDELKEVYAPCLAVVGTMALLIVLEPDLGTAFSLMLTTCILFFLAGIRYKYISIIGASALAVLAVMIMIAPYRIVRIISYLNPGGDPRGSNYQLINSLVAIGSGGITGKNFGAGLQKAFFLPEPHTDFIYSVIGEELGFIGTMLVLAAFFIILWRGVRISVRTQDRFGYFVAMGITSMIVIQALLNIAVAIGLVPTKGMPLPFISYGGSSLLANLIGVGVLLNISQHSD
jgi:cell division protein FtsW